MLCIGMFLQPHPVIPPHECAFARMQHRFSAALLDFELTGTQIDKRMFPVFVGTAPVVGEKTRYQDVRTVEYMQSFHIVNLCFLQR